MVQGLGCVSCIRFHDPFPIIAIQNQDRLQELSQLKKDCGELVDLGGCKLTVGATWGVPQKPRHSSNKP